jgi:hypothetical protein
MSNGRIAYTKRLKKLTANALVDEFAQVVISACNYGDSEGKLALVGDELLQRLGKKWVKRLENLEHHH